MITERQQRNFHAKIDKSQDCWEWTASKVSNGYGAFQLGVGKTVRAHMLMLQLHNGKEISTQDHVCHKCDNPACVNPEHLFLGDALINNQDMMAKGRNRHLSGEDNPSAKLSNKQAADIVNDERKHQQIADSYGVSRSLITQIKNGYIRNAQLQEITT